jgi:hypothetical protein
VGDLRELTDAELDSVGGGQLRLPVSTIGGSVRGLAHVFAAIAILNIVSTIEVINETLYGSTKPSR